MSRRALRRLRGEQRGQEQPGLGELGLEPDPEAGRDGLAPALPGAAGRGRRGTGRSGVSNRFELITAEESEDELLSQADARLREQEANEGAVAEEAEGHGQKDGEETEQLDQMPVLSNKPRKKKKKRKTKKTPAGDTVEDNDLEDIDSLLEKIEETNGLSQQTQDGILTDSRPLLYVEHRNLNPENELKRYFGARAVLGDQRPRQRQRQYVRSTWLTAPKNTWPRYSKTGIAMQLLDSRRGVQHFTFEHHREYQQVQFKFLDAVESMDPNNIVLLLQMNPYHVDSLLQLSDVCRMQEDQEMARDLVERALYSLECAFHPVFSLTSGTCRLDYRRPENRAFFLALFKHLMFLEKRGCPRTALEFCKLILSLDPENDPLCVLLLIDFLSLRAREYTFLTRMFQEWESHRNLSQLPNFAFSVPLAYFFLSQQEERSELELSQARERAARLLQLALVMFPGVLMPLLDHCSVQPDARVASHSFFGLNAQLSQPPALNQLTSLYVARTHSLWKDPAVMAWLETNVHEVLCRVDARDPLVEECEHKRKTQYQGAPRNIYRHVILSEMKEATAALPLVRGPDRARAVPLPPPLRALGTSETTVASEKHLPDLRVSSMYTQPPGQQPGRAWAAWLQLVRGSVVLPEAKGCRAGPTPSVPLWVTQPSPLLSPSLPQEVTSQPVMGFDPLPPLDSIVSYTRPERTSHPPHESSLSLFFRSLLPNFNLQGDIRHEGDEEAGAVQDLNQGVNRLMAAMRDMLANIQFQEPPRDDNPEGDGDWD
ncbi:ribosome quality control complex subunit TCF25 isoform X2 [Colius striatus]|uniref:ribosome quality control complex subunit TCF25 isoform X2 n=1 Tax=Colius striatus TaxID=57412 RepID=UPI002B1DA8D6|nr:ribosome quality control complex subunit TCF25 isoform X2 [Colius striatus]